MKRNIRLNRSGQGLWKICPVIVEVFILSFICTMAIAQNTTISGNIKNTSGEFLSGVTVVVKGTTNGTTSNNEGHFVLSNVPNDTTIVFSYIGYKSKEIKVANDTHLDIVLYTSAKELNQVVVVGYGTQKKIDLTGSVATADLKAFSESPNVNIMQSLHGSVAGVNIGQVNQAGEEPAISIRGQTTLNGNQNPLIVVDGIIYQGRIGDLNPGDIKSVNILKDASSKAIYGSQAANGVLLITTKRGKRYGKPTVNYSGSFSTQTPTVRARPLNRSEFLQKVKDVEYHAAYLAPDYTKLNPDWDFDQSELLPSIREGIKKGTNYNWWKALTSSSYIMNHLLNITGGSKSTTYYLSGGYTNQKGIIKNDIYKRATVRINIQTDITNWLTLGTNTFGSFDNFSGNSPSMGSLVTTSPLVTPKDSSGEFIIDPVGNNQTNPFLNAEADDRDLNNRISGNFYAILKVPKIDGLTYRINYSNDLNWFYHAYSNKYDAGQTGAAYKANASNLDVTIDNILTYDKQLNDHNLKITLVAGENKVKYNRTEASGQNIPDLGLSYNSLQQSITQTITSSAWKKTSIYQVARLNYNYNSRYLLTATLRRDGFSGFAKNNKIALFPSLGVAWVLSKELFFKVPVINLLKFRASYGKTGNQTSRYSSLAVVNRGEDSKYVFGDGNSTVLGQTVSSLGNNDLSWEITSGLNLGIDLSILDGRIRGNIEYYKTNTNDLLWNMAIPQMTGFSSIRTNLGKIANTGFEFSISTVPVETNEFGWNLDVNFSSNKNKIVRLIGNSDLVANKLFIGKSIGAIYDYQVDGIWQLTDKIPSGYSPGTYRIVDQNGDGIIAAADDRKILGRSEPAYEIGIQNTLKYKNITLRFFIHTIQGGKDGYLKINYPSAVGNTSGNAQQANWLTFSYNNIWSPSHPNRKYPQRWVNTSIMPKQYFSRSFVRLQDISLSYQLNNSVLKRLNLGEVKVYMSGKNILTFTKWDGWDPETGQGIAGSTPYPVLKAYTFGINVSF